MKKSDSLRKKPALLKWRAVTTVMSCAAFAILWCFLDNLRPSLSLIPRDEEYYVEYYATVLFGAVVWAIAVIAYNPRYWTNTTNAHRSLDSETRKRARRSSLSMLGICFLILISQVLFDGLREYVSFGFLILGYAFLESALGMVYDLVDERAFSRLAETHPMKKEIDSFHSLVEIVRGNNADFELEADGKEIACLLKTQKLVLSVGSKSLKTLFRADVDYEIQKQLAKRDRVIASADEILKAARKRGLHPVVFKGLAYERCVYGDVARRDAGDLDLLVFEEEVPAVHELLLSLGYKQQIGPSSAGGSRQSRALAAVRASQNEADGTTTQGAPARRHPYKGELSPYIRIDSPTVEVHDGFVQLPEWFLREVIEKAKKGFVVDPLHNLVFLLANAYENSESLFSNCFDDGVVLRDVVDLREFWLKYRDSLDWKAAARLVDEVGLHDRAARVLGDLEEVYGSVTVAGLLPDIERVHGYGRPCFLERACSEEVARGIALSYLREKIEEEASAKPVGILGESECHVAGSRSVLRVMKTSGQDGGIALEIDGVSSSIGNGQILQVIFYYLEGGCDAVGYKVTLFNVDGQLRAVGNESRRLLNGAALLKDSGTQLPVTPVEEDDSGCVRVLLEDIPKQMRQSLEGRGIAIDASFYVHNHANVYWRREEPVVMIADEVAAGNLWLLKDGWDNLLLSFSSSDFVVAANDRSLLDDLRTLFPSSLVNSMTVASDVRLTSVAVQKDAADSYSVAAPGDEVKLGLSREEALGLVLQLVMESIVHNVIEPFAVLHAAAVVRDNKAAVLIGASGSGKSSLAFALRSNAILLGDECVCVDMDGGTVWCEEYPVNIKSNNMDIVPRIPDDELLRAEWGGKFSFYCPAEHRACGRFEISHIFAPHYDREGPAAALGDIECEKLVPVVAGSLLGEPPQSELFARFIKMVGRHGMKTTSLRYSDVDAAAALVLQEMDGGSNDI